MAIELLGGMGKKLEILFSQGVDAHIILTLKDQSGKELGWINVYKKELLEAINNA